jgi:hypothetical protein
VRRWAFASAYSRGSPAAAGVRAVAARSGAQFHPARPDSVIGPRRSGGALPRSAPGSVATSSAPAAAHALPASASAAIRAQRRKFIGAIVPRVREAILSLAVALAALVCPLAANADELLVGALRDQDGAVVVGARISALDASGTVVARDRSAADGTFALTVPGTPVAVLVDADDADPLRIAVTPSGAPLVAILHRYRSADVVPSAADVSALPAGSLAALASVIPFRVTNGSISDRALGDDRGAVTVEGLEFYRPDGSSDATDLLPGHAVGAVSAIGPLSAPWYGDRAGGGLIDARLFDRTDDVRLTGADAFVEAGSRLAGLAATSWDPDGQRRLVAARDEFAIGPASATVVALAGDAPDAVYDGVGANLRFAGPRLQSDAQLQFTRDAATDVRYGIDAGNVVSATLDLSGPGPDALLVRGRWRDEQSAYGDAAFDHHDAAIVVGTDRGAVTHVSVALALAYGDDAYDGKTTSGLALLPTVSIDTPLQGNWSLHAGLADATLDTPGDAQARASLGEAGLVFAAHRLRAEALVYAEAASDPRALDRGVAVDVGWEIAPRVSLRTWTLNDLTTANTIGYPPPYAPAQGLNVEAYRRGLVWLTWDAPARFDVLVRAGALEGDARIPLGSRYALSAGSYRAASGHRIFDVGLIAR